MKTLILVFAGFSLLASLSVRANYIREQNGILTTDVPGLTITANPSTPGGEGWDLTVIFKFGAGGDTAVIPGALAELSGESGLYNKLNFVNVPALNTTGLLTFHWESDVPLPPLSLASPSGIETIWSLGGVSYRVSFEDLGDAPTSVPDGGSSAALLALSLAGCFGLRKKFANGS